MLWRSFQPKRTTSSRPSWTSATQSSSTLPPWNHTWSNPSRGCWSIHSCWRSSTRSRTQTVRSTTTWMVRPSHTRQWNYFDRGEPSWKHSDSISTPTVLFAVAMKAMNKVASHINEMQKIHEEFGAVFDLLITEQSGEKKVVCWTNVAWLCKLQRTVEWLTLGILLLLPGCWLVHGWSVTPHHRDLDQPSGLPGEMEEGAPDGNIWYVVNKSAPWLWQRYFHVYCPPTLSHHSLLQLTARLQILQSFHSNGWCFWISFIAFQCSKWQLSLYARMGPSRKRKWYGFFFFYKSYLKCNLFTYSIENLLHTFSESAKWVTCKIILKSY